MDNLTPKITYEQFRDVWLEDIVAEKSTIDKGRLFAQKLISEWIDMSPDDVDFYICDGSGDGGIDIACLVRAEGDDSDSREGDTWYIVQSKYGSAFSGKDTIHAEGNKVLDTLEGKRQRLSQSTDKLMQRISNFRSRSTDADKIVLVFATTDPIPQRDRSALDSVRKRGRDCIAANFDVAEVSVKTLWWRQTNAEKPQISFTLKGKFVSDDSDMLVGAVSLPEMYDFLKSYQNTVGEIYPLYAANIRQTLSGSLKANMEIAKTLANNPHKFGHYNNGINIVVSGFNQLSPHDGVYTVILHNPSVVNGCQTTHTIWEVLRSKVDSGGSGNDGANDAWEDLLKKGTVVVKISRGTTEDKNAITRFANLQTAVRPVDFLALSPVMQKWADDMARDYNIFLEIQRGSAALHQKGRKSRMDAYVDPPTLLRVYAAGWLREVGGAYGSNQKVLVGTPLYQRIVKRTDGQPDFGARDLYAAWRLHEIAEEVGFGRSRKAKQTSRKQTRHLFIFIMTEMLASVMRLTSGLPDPSDPSVLTEAVTLFTEHGNSEKMAILVRSALNVLDKYFDENDPLAIFQEDLFTGGFNDFFKSPRFGKDETYAPRLAQAIDRANDSFAIYQMDMNDPSSPPLRDFFAEPLLASMVV